MKNYSESFTLKDAVYIVIFLIVVISCLIAFILFANNAMGFLSTLSGVLSIVISILAIIITFISSLSIGGIDNKIDEMKKTMYIMSNEKQKYENIIFKLEMQLEALKKADLVSNGTASSGEVYKEVEDELFNLKKSLNVVASKMFED